MAIKSKLVAGGDGTAIPSGMVGREEISTVTTNVAGSTTVGTYTNTGCSITLGVGVWDIEAFGTGYMAGSNGTGTNGRTTRFQIYNSTDAAILTGGVGGFISSDIGAILVAFHISKRIEITSGTKTIVTRFTTSENSSATTLTSSFVLGATEYPLTLRAVLRG